ncbi:hypothetical protein BJ165DRAFT_693016 [Panaeolus papilionaceus]|nr:hypothetical protein BJ165DRAFT_693016 [Panaeolus papilionaceus]
MNNICIRSSHSDSYDLGQMPGLVHALHTLLHNDMNNLRIKSHSGAFVASLKLPHHGISPTFHHGRCSTLTSPSRSKARRTVLFQSEAQASDAQTGYILLGGRNWNCGVIFGFEGCLYPSLPWHCIICVCAPDRQVSILLPPVTPAKSVVLDA